MFDGRLSALSDCRNVLSIEFTPAVEGGECALSPSRFIMFPSRARRKQTRFAQQLDEAAYFQRVSIQRLFTRYQSHAGQTTEQIILR